MIIFLELFDPISCAILMVLNIWYDDIAFGNAPCKLVNCR